MVAARRTRAVRKPKGKLIGIAIKRKPRQPMETFDRIEISLERGLAGDARGPLPGRQVTVVFKDGWNATCAALGRDLPWTTRRANLFVDGVSGPQTVGARIRVGDALLEVTEETAPCIVMERNVPGLRNAMRPEWRGGVTCAVIDGGEIALGDAVEIIPAEVQSPRQELPGAPAKLRRSS